MLYLVPTPIGNLEDITLRALQVLKTAEYVLAEDTRITRKLLSHYQISAPLKAYHAHNEHIYTKTIVRDLVLGKDIAMVCDAGTPGISDPGYLLVNACLEQGLPFTCLPGATSVIPALVMSGLPLHDFQYTGFLPQKKGRKSAWERIAQNSMTTVLLESPHRLLKFLGEALQYCDSGRSICVIREISKIHEEVRRGSVEEVLEYYRDHPEKCAGEIVIVIGPRQ